MPRETILPRTVVPEYLDETPLAVQDRHVAEGNFSMTRPHLTQAGDRPAFPRPSMTENLQLIEDNLARPHGAFDSRHRKVETP